MKRMISVAMVSSLALLAVECSSSSQPIPDATQSGSAVDVVDLTVGVIPAAELAALQLGIERGFFEDEGLNVTTQVGAGAAALAPALVAGQLDFMWSGASTTVNGIVQGLPLQVVAPGAASGENWAIVVPENSEATSLDDLRGQRIAVATLGSLADVIVRGAFAEAGISTNEWEPVEIGFPDVAAALASGQIDAAVVVEPSLTINTDSGAKVASNPSLEVNGGEPLAVTEWITTDTFDDENPGVVDRFRRAIVKSNQYANTHEDEARAAMLELLPNVDPAVLSEIALPTWPDSFDSAAYQSTIDLLVEHTGVQNPPSADEVLPGD